jgi:hypothetical protein
MNELSLEILATDNLEAISSFIKSGGDCSAWLSELTRNPIESTYEIVVSLSEIDDRIRVKPELVDVCIQAQIPHLDSFVALALRQNCPPTQTLLDWAIITKNAEMVKYCINLKITSDSIMLAIAFGTLEIVQYLLLLIYDHNWEANWLTLAVESRDDSVANYLFNEGCPGTFDTAVACISFNKPKLFKTIVEAFCIPVDSMLLRRAIKSRNQEIIEYCKRVQVSPKRNTRVKRKLSYSHK